MKTLIVIQGPTASGKTSLAIQLAQSLGTAIVSADSRQCYKAMTIGTAKPSVSELAQVKHYFIDEFPIDANLTAADFERLALGYLEEIFKTNNEAILCGGTGLYIKALCEGLDEMPGIDEAINELVNEEYKHKGMNWLQEAVQHEDPVFFEQGEIQNPARLLRALSFKRSTGQSILAYRTGTKKDRGFNIIKFTLDVPRDILYNRINDRVAAMMADGLLGEVSGLEAYKHLKNLQTVGYSELFDFLDGNGTLEQAIDKIKQHTRNYAKRQVTWFKKDIGTILVDPTDANVLKIILSYLQKGSPGS